MDITGILLAVQVIGAFIGAGIASAVAVLTSRRAVKKEVKQEVQTEVTAAATSIKESHSTDTEKLKEGVKTELAAQTNELRESLTERFAQAILADQEQNQKLFDMVLAAKDDSISTLRYQLEGAVRDIANFKELWQARDKDAREQADFSRKLEEGLRTVNANQISQGRQFQSTIDAQNKELFAKDQVIATMRGQIGELEIKYARLEETMNTKETEMKAEIERLQRERDLAVAEALREKERADRAEQERDQARAELFQIKRDTGRLSAGGDKATEAAQPATNESPVTSN